ncbi:MAG: asparagine synthase, glutamine-hydrolyzing [Schlesneria sp.]|nr:asparagine synthase, glutamine-hydrolyzing [Schlesneria sp.]
MCGFAGFMMGESDRDIGGAELARAADRMADRISHRGPDDAGVWSDAAHGVALSFRRLAILDLTDAGHQPMASPTGNFVIVFNGEIYNHKDVLKDLRSRNRQLSLRGHSDTEILAAGFEEWGIVETLRRCVGMFAVAVWDQRSRRLHLARDRFGEKPLYFGISKKTLLFGSELSALTSHPAFVPNIDRDALGAFMRFGYVPVPQTIYKNIWKLQPGAMISFSADHVLAGRVPELTKFWSVEDAYQQSTMSPFLGTDADAAASLENILRRTVREQSVADVPLGAFLSGGIDSSLVVALMQAESSRPVKTFSIGFHESKYNEAHFAKAVAGHLRTDHTELYVTAADALAVIPSLPDVYDEPFADSSQIPTLLVSKLARSHVTVSLSGDGGDEIFGGYERYQLMQRVWRATSMIPSSLRIPIGRQIASLSAIRSAKSGSLANKANWASRFLAAKSFDGAYRAMISSWNDPESVVLGLSRQGSHPASEPVSRAGSLLRRMMLTDTVAYLPDDILVKVDRATMHVGLESRSPLLDHRVIEFAMSLPDRMLVRNGVTKWIMRDVLYRHVPRSLIDRPKKGFAVPIAEWLRGPLRAWAEHLLDHKSISGAGYLDAQVIQKIWQEHLVGGCNRAPQLWNVLMFQSWMERATELVQVPGRNAA